MKLAVIQCSNGSFSIVSEHGEDIQAARLSYFERCKILWNAADVITGEVAIVDEQLDVVEGYKEFISHEVTVAPVVEEGAEE